MADKNKPALANSDPTMDAHADELHGPVSASQYGGNTAKNATGKPFQQKMVPESGATKLSRQMGQAGKLAGSIGEGFNSIVKSLSRKP